MANDRHRGRSHGRKKKGRLPPGTIPGTILLDPESPKPVITAIVYKGSVCHEKSILSVAELPPLPTDGSVLWVHVTGLGDEVILRGIADHFHLHRLALEDVVNVHQRAKVEDYPDHFFIVMRIPLLVEGCLEGTEQVSLFLGKNFILSIDERPPDPFDLVRQRIRTHGGIICNHGPDFLAYALIDCMVDTFFPVLDALVERIDGAEQRILAGETGAIMNEIYSLKGDLLTLRRAIWPMREATMHLLRADSPIILPESRPFLRDCTDHVAQLMDIVEVYRDHAANLADLYHSVLGNRLNEVMKFLTMISVIFIPLSFIAGIYGMNFDTESSPYNMPELRWFYGYPMAIGLMLLVAVVLLFFFRKKGWLRED